MSKKQTKQQISKSEVETKMYRACSICLSVVDVVAVPVTKLQVADSFYGESFPPI